MSDYRDDQDRFLQELDELAKMRQAVAWERRLKELCARLGDSRTAVLKRRERIIGDAMTLFKMTREAAETWVDANIGLEPKN